jgi:hypothetical protein
VQRESGAAKRPPSSSAPKSLLEAAAQKPFASSANNNGGGGSSSNAKRPGNSSSQQQQQQQYQSQLKNSRDLLQDTQHQMQRNSSAHTIGSNNSIHIDVNTQGHYDPSLPTNLDELV